MNADPDFLDSLFEDFPPDPPKKKAPARTVNADTGNGNQTCEEKIAPQSLHLKPKVVKQRVKNLKPETQVSWAELDFEGEKCLLRGKSSGKAPSGQILWHLGSGLTIKKIKKSSVRLKPEYDACVRVPVRD